MIIHIGFLFKQLVESLPGVEVSCSPPERNVEIQDNNGKAACQWVFNLHFQVSEIFTEFSFINRKRFMQEKKINKRF